MNWNKINTHNRRERSVTMAIIGDGLNPETFDEMIAHNHGEIPNNGIDDDGNGYVDDYYGLDLVLGNGTNYTNRQGVHETKVASLVAMISDFHKEQIYPIKIIPITVQNPKGYDSLYIKRLADAIDYAVARGAEVINISGGISSAYRGYFQFIEGNYQKSRLYIDNAIARAHAQGVHIVAAVSNDRTRNQTKEPHFPADLKHVISVSGVDLNHRLTRAYGKIIMTAFYSEKISTYIGNNEFKRTSGTSYATPMISAIIALKLSQQSSKKKINNIKRKIKNASQQIIRSQRKIRNGVFSPEVFLAP